MQATNVEVTEGREDGAPCAERWEGSRWVTRKIVPSGNFLRTWPISDEGVRASGHDLDTTISPTNTNTTTTKTRSRNSTTVGIHDRTKLAEVFFFHWSHTTYHETLTEPADLYTTFLTLTEGNENSTIKLFNNSSKLKIRRSKIYKKKTTHK